MIRANTMEDREAIIMRFLNGLNHNIANIVELQHDIKLEDMVHVDTKVERELKCKGSTWKVGNLGFFFHHEGGIIREKGITQPKHNGTAKAKPSKIKKEVVVDFKGKTRTQPIYNHDINYLRCLEVRHITSQCSNK